MEAIIDSFGLNWKVFLAEIVNFIIVLGIIYWIVKNKVMPHLDLRQETIKSGVENAEKAGEMLASAESEKEAILTDAQNKASDTIADSVKKGKERESTILADADNKASDIISKAQAKGELEKEGIIASSKEEIAKMITLGAQKVLASK